jgi:glycyl-tRNA synthetase beta chain
MSTQPLLIEIGCEELPPKSLLTLVVSFADSVHALLNERGVEVAYPSYFATPRRLALLFDAVPTQQPDKQIQRKGPAVNAAYDKDGNPTKAALGFAQSCGVAFDALEKLSTPQGEWLVFNANQKGVETLLLLPEIITQALLKLPIAKRMRWGASQIEFVRPIHWVLGLLGEKVIPGEVFGIKPDRITYGHRFHHPDAIRIKHPDEYVTALRAVKVEPCLNTRCDSIRKQVEKQVKKVGGVAPIDGILLEEVAALVEWPVALVGRFENKFLDVPHEALVSTMTGNQKYFPVFQANSTNLMPYFIFITNIESKNPPQIIEGNEKVIRPRFSDAQFFFEQDKKHSLESRLPSLEKMLFHPKLGSLKDKSIRLQSVARNITNMIGFRHLDDALPEKAALLCKTDLLTDMVFEFPELQGTMGYYYAHNDGLGEGVAHAIKEHYLPRFASDALPKTPLGQILALADRLDTLIGIFAIGQAPTGDKDPFALRRAVLGVLRILIEENLSLDLRQLLQHAASALIANRPDIKCDDNTVEAVVNFALDRLQNIYQEQGFTTEEFLVTRAQKITNPVYFDAHIRAIHAVSQSPEIKALASANKRIANILAKVDSSFVKASVNEALLTEAAEKNLFSALTTAQQKIAPLQASKNFEKMMLSLAELKTPVDTFFDSVMVNAEDTHIRNNRLNLLQALRDLFLSVADISLLSISK